MRQQDPAALPGDGQHPTGSDWRQQAARGHARSGEQDRGDEARPSRVVQLGDSGAPGEGGPLRRSVRPLCKLHQPGAETEAGS